MCLTAIIAATAAVANLAGGYIAGQGAAQAGDIQAGAARDAFDLMREDTEQYREAGLASLAEWRAIMSGEQDFRTDPGYEFRLAEGEDALGRAGGLPGGGGRYSGATLRSLMEHGQGVASAEYDRVLGRHFGMAQMGGQHAGAGVDYLTQEANARAAGVAGQASAYGQGISGAGTAAMLPFLFGGGGAPSATAGTTEAVSQYAGGYPST